MQDEVIIKKYQRKSSLNQRSIELVEKFKQYNSLSDDNDMKPILKYYIENKLNFKVKDFELFKTETDFISYLTKDKKNLISEKEQIEGSKDFANDILDFDKLKIKSKTNAKTKCLIITKSIGLKKTDCEKLFENFHYADFDPFVKNFVDKYMRKNAMLFISAIHQNNFKVTFSEIYQSSFGYWNFDIDFNIKIDDLDEIVLTEIGKTLMNMPKFA